MILKFQYIICLKRAILGYIPGFEKLCQYEARYFGFVKISQSFTKSPIKIWLISQFTIKGMYVHRRSLANLHTLLCQLVYEPYPLIDYMSLVMRNPFFCICENKDADQLRGNCEADQSLCFRCLDSTIPLLPKSEISTL